MKAFEALSSEDGDCIASLHTLATGCVNPGDLVMLPAGYITTQKAVNCHTTGIRVTSHVLFHDAIAGQGTNFFLGLCNDNATVKPF